MVQLLDIISSPATWIVLLIWALICILYADKRDPFLTRTWDLISKPNVFKVDQTPRSYRFYSRENMEDIAKAFLSALKTPFNEIVAQFKNWILAQVNIVHNKERPLRILGFLIYLAFLVVFVWADAISVVNTLYTLDLYTDNIPPWLGNWGIAVTMGSLGAAVVAGLIAMDIHGKKSILSWWEEHGDNSGWKTFGKVAIRIVAVLAAVVVLFFGIQRLTVLQPVYTSSPIVTFLVDTIVAIAVPLNTVLTTTLIALEGLLGLFLIAITLQAFLLGAVIVINCITTGLAYFIPWLLDTTYRILLLVLDLGFYVIATPFQWIGHIITAPFRPRK